MLPFFCSFVYCILFWAMLNFIDFSTKNFSFMVFYFANGGKNVWGLKRFSSAILGIWVLRHFSVQLNSLINDNTKRKKRILFTLDHVCECDVVFSIDILFSCVFLHLRSKDFRSNIRICKIFCTPNNKNTHKTTTTTWKSEIATVLRVKHCKNQFDNKMLLNILGKESLNEYTFCAGHFNLQFCAITQCGQRLKTKEEKIKIKPNEKLIHKTKNFTSLKTKTDEKQKRDPQKKKQNIKRVETEKSFLRS